MIPQQPPQGLLQLLLGGIGGAPPPEAGMPMEPMAPPPPVPPMWSAYDPSEMIEEIPLDSATEQKIKTFLNDEIRRAQNYTKMVHQRAREYRELYAEYRGPKSFPWEKCSNIAVSMIAPHVQQVVARNYRVLKSTSPAILVEPLPDCPDALKSEPMRREIQDYLNAKILEDREFSSALFELILDATIIGTSVAKVVWTSRSHIGRQYEISPMGVPKITSREIIDFEGSTLEPIRIEDIFLPAESFSNPNALQESQWVSHRYFERWGVAQEKAKQGIYRKDPLKMLSWAADQSDAQSTRPISTFIDPATRVTGAVEAPTHESANELSLHEVYCRMSLRDGEPERDCVFVYSYKHDVLLRAIYNPYFHGRRPFSRLVYWPVPNSFLGRGIPDQLRHTQVASNDILNAAIDALTLENTPVIVTGKQAGLKPGKNDRIWPGRWITLDEPDTFRQVQIRGPSEQTMAFIGQLERFGQRASGVSDALLGGESAAGNRETAEGALTRQGASSPMFDVVLDEIRRCVAEIADYYLSNCQQFHPKGQAYQGGGAPSFLEIPPGESVLNRFRFRVVTSTVAANPEVRKVTLQHFLATITPLVQDLMQMAGAMADPNAPPPTVEVMRAAFPVKYTLLRQLAQSFEIPGAEQLLPPWEEFQQVLLPSIEQAKQAASQQPPKLEDSVARKVFPNFTNLFAEEAISVLEMAGIPAGSERVRLAEIEKSSGQPPPFGGGEPAGGMPPLPGGPMGPGFPGGPGGIPGAPPQMPGLPFPG